MHHGIGHMASGGGGPVWGRWTLHPLDNTPRQHPPPTTPTTPGQHPPPGQQLPPLDNNYPLDNIPPGQHYPLDNTTPPPWTTTTLPLDSTSLPHHINSVYFNLFHRNKECALNKGHFYLGFIHSMHIHYLILYARNNMCIHFFFMHVIYFGCGHFNCSLRFNILMGKSHCLLRK